MSVLFVTHYSGFYGANKSLLTLMCLLRERHGITPLVLLPSEGPMCKVLEQVGIEYKVSHYYWWVNDNHGIFQWLLNKRKQLRNYCRIQELCKLFANKKIDLVYTNSVCVNVGYFMAKRIGLPHIWQARESLSMFNLSLSHFVSRKIWADTVNKCYIMISDSMMSFYSKYLPVNRMVRVYNGVSLPEGVARINKNIINKRLQVACVGVLSSQKNQLELLRAQSILHKRGIDIDTWMIGSNKKEYLQQLQNYVATHNLQEYVHFVGHADDVWDILQNMNLGVVCARDEAFGRVTVEYMLMQMPVVVARSGANAELVDEGVTGEVYEFGNAQMLADKIEYYINHPDLLTKAGLLAEEKAKREFSAEQNAEHIYIQIEKVLKERL